MTEFEFFERLEYRICRELESSRLPEAPGLWCDGLIPEFWQFDAQPPSVSGKAWFGGLPNRDSARYQEDWVFVLELPHDVASRESIPWERLLPPELARNWMTADVKHRQLHMVLPPARTDGTPRASRARTTLAGRVASTAEPYAVGQISRLMSPPSECSPENVVAVVLDGDFSARLQDVSQRARVWIVDTAENRIAASTVRMAGRSAGTRTPDVTTFEQKVEWSVDAAQAHLLDTVLEHHPACLRLELFGVGTTRALVERLASFGFIRESRADSSLEPTVFVRDPRRASGQP